MKFFRVAGFVLPVAVATVFGQQQRSIEIEDHRPIAKALDEINRIGSVTIHYEDVRFEHPQDIEDVTERVRNPLHKGPVRQVLVPRPRAISVAFEVDQDGRLADPAAVYRAVQALVAANDVADPPGKFRIERSGETDLFVVPETVRGADGSYRAYFSVLLTPITIYVKSVSGSAALKEVLSAASMASGQKLGLGSGPFEGLAYSRVSLNAVNQPAGKVIVDLLRQMGGRFAIRLLHGPGSNSHALNLHPLAAFGPSPGSTPPPISKPPAPEPSGQNPFLWHRTP